MDAAKEALTDMPPRGEEELDHVSLHNLVRVASTLALYSRVIAFMRVVLFVCLLVINTH